MTAIELSYAAAVESMHSDIYFLLLIYHYYNEIA